MVTHEDLVALMGEPAIFRYPDRVLQRMELTADARRTLGQVGVPRGPNVLGITMVTELEDIHVPVHLDGSADRWYKIGRDYETAICVSSSIGDVWSVSLDGAYPRAFMNSSIQAFVDFLYLYCGTWADVPAITSPDAIQEWEAHWQQPQSTKIESTVEMWWRIDPKALANPDTYWSQILEQMNDGLL